MCTKEGGGAPTNYKMGTNPTKSCQDVHLVCGLFVCLLVLFYFFLLFFWYAIFFHFLQKGFFFLLCLTLKTLLET